MNRRRFIGLLAGAGASIAAPTYFFAPKGGWKTSASGLWLRPQNAALFVDGQSIEIYGAMGGFAKMRTTIKAVDTLTNTLWLDTCQSVDVGDLILLGQPRGTWNTGKTLLDGVIYSEGAGVLDVVREC
jgi:hypothetical protein